MGRGAGSVVTREIVHTLHGQTAEVVRDVEWRAADRGGRASVLGSD